MGAEKNKTNAALKTFNGELSGAPWHNRSEACQVVAFLAFISGCGVAEGGRVRLAEQSRAGEILQGEGKREGRGKHEEHRWERQRERQDIGGKTMEALPSLSPCLLPCTVDWREVLRCEQRERERKSKRGHNMVVMFDWTEQEWSVLFLRLLCRPVSERGSEQGAGHRRQTQEFQVTSAPVAERSLGRLRLNWYSDRSWS